MLAESLVRLGTLAIAFYIWQRWNYSYWERNGVKYIKPLPILGNLLLVIFKGKAEPVFEKEPFVGIYLAHPLLD